MNRLTNDMITEMQKTGINYGINFTTGLQQKSDVDVNQFIDYHNLISEEKRIYDSVMLNFPATKHESAMNVALQGGISFNYISK